MDHLSSGIRREMIYVVKHKPFLDLLSISHPIQQQALLNSASAEQVRCLCNCLENIPYQEDNFRPFKKELAELTDRNSSFQKEKANTRSAWWWFPCKIMYSDQGNSDEHCRIQDILEYLNLNKSNSAEELLQSILTSTDILTWNSKGEIVYKGHDIRGTDIVDLVRYCLMPYNQDIPEPAGLSLFLKGLAELEIDKSLIAIGRVLTRLARKDHVPIKDFDDSETVSDCT